MIVPIQNTLIKRKSFKAFFTIGLLCVLVAVVLRVIVNSNQDSCIYDDYCDSTYGGPDLCLDQSYIYCCGGYGNDFCGGRNDCYEVTPINGKIQCQGLVTAYWVLEGIAIFFLFILMIISCRHRRRVQTIRLAPHLPELHQNVFYSDDNFNRVHRQPQPRNQQLQYQDIIINESVQGDNPYGGNRN